MANHRRHARHRRIRAAAGEQYRAGAFAGVGDHHRQRDAQPAGAIHVRGANVAAADATEVDAARTVSHEKTDRQRTNGVPDKNGRKKFQDF